MIIKTQDKQISDAINKHFQTYLLYEKIEDNEDDLLIIILHPARILIKVNFLKLSMIHNQITEAEKNQIFQLQKIYRCNSSMLLTIPFDNNQFDKDNEPIFEDI